MSSASHSLRANGNHGPKSSQDASTANPPDIAALIAAAGSPEAALMSLWKEKQSASSHSTQLWRLVEKQRAMIIGLQKDLERTLKEKDRYRKRLRDYTNQVPPIPGAPQRSDTFDSVVEREESQSPAPSERQEDFAKPTNVTKPAEHKASPLTQETSAAQLLPDSQLAQSPTHSSDAHTSSNPVSVVNSPTDYSVKPLLIANKGLGLSTALVEGDPIVESPTESPEATTSLRKASAAAEGGLQAPQLSLTQATPVIGGDGFEAPVSKPTQALRKAPPAPLNLSKPVKTSAHLLQADPGEHDDSDYDDTLEIDEIPIVERGRRKTREEDDRMRDVIALKEEGTRSMSKKKKSESKSKVSSPEPKEGAEQPSTASLSPRQFSPLQAGLPLSPRHPPANSLNALLSPANSDSSMVAQRSIVSSPLMSPGLPTSPRPGDRPLGSPLPRNPKQTPVSPPMSPRSIPNGMPPPATRAPRQPVPLPPNTPQSYTSPQTARPEAPAQAKQQTLGSDLLKPSSAQLSPETGDLSSSEHVHRGLVSDQYPGLLLPPNALPSIEVKVSSSRLRPSRMSFLAPRPQEEDPVFHLAIYARSDGKQLWRMEKTIVALPALDAQLKSLSDFSGKLPDRALFSGHAPARVDARRVALNQYFDTILETPMNEQAALVVCDFFSTDVMGAQIGDTLAPEPAAPQAVPAPKGRQVKEGYLTKRGKNFGGWKARHFVLDGPEFRYYEVAGGAHLGTIKLLNAQIGKQSQQQTNQSPQRRDDSEDNQYRHAFLILEPKRKDSSSLVRHVLCAESDEERDAWVEALLQHVDLQEESSPIEGQAPAHARPAVLTKTQGKDSSRSGRKESPEQDKSGRVQALSYEDTIAAEAPMRGPSHREAKDAHGQSPKSGSFSNEALRHYPSISGPTNGAPIQNLENWGNKPVAVPTATKDKKRSIFGFSSRPRGPDPIPDPSMNQQRAPDRLIQQNRNVFGIPLAEAVEYTQPIGLNDPLPSVVYRSLEYLRAKNASSEEGIFRLSGSNIVIRALRERFNTEGDVKLLDGQYYDIHAVASLLKLFLRELPASILTRELHLDFLKVLDLDERSKKIQAFNVLVHRLPRVNFELLRHMSSFLIEIVENAGVNKMTVRNVGIVFAPTLNIPAPLISFFLTDYQDIFGVPVEDTSLPHQDVRTTSYPVDETRSPGQQTFPDGPSLAYNDSPFQPQVALNQQQWNGRPPSAFPMSSAPAYPPPQPPQQQQQHYAQHAGYDTGFVPVRPRYDSPSYEQQYQSADAYGSLNLNSARQPGSAREQKQKRRESSMLLMNVGMGQRKGSNGSNPPRHREELRGNPMLIREETAFD
ncbi:Rho GTPase activating protein [Didymosphaeria variabile]|uniref:Rho GTPase activating protein n=1 Tax=Didymosphaeria variabile TaxID=1932322 RepID=A0A9W8X917_9PLEO|nr:Rho GTPase activating protein [Didymosphaeria variabile]KAJ4344406.1 Rho GTPase activating protein [Didymosphaeria variabile]